MKITERMSVMETKMKLFEKAVYALILINLAELGVVII